MARSHRLDKANPGGYQATKGDPENAVKLGAAPSQAQDHAGGGSATVALQEGTMRDEHGSIPWRGAEQHGVANPPSSTEHYMWDELGHLTDNRPAEVVREPTHENDPDPIPVRIVADLKSPLRHITFTRFRTLALDGTIEQSPIILPRNPHRKEAIIYNLPIATAIPNSGAAPGGATIWLSHKRGEWGYPLAVGASYTHKTQGELYAYMVNQTDKAMLSISSNQDEE